MGAAVAATTDSILTTGFSIRVGFPFTVSCLVPTGFPKERKIERKKANQIKFDSISLVVRNSSDCSCSIFIGRT